MDELFAKLALQTASTVTRIAINHATNAALKSVTSYLVNQPKTKQQQTGIEQLQRQLDLRIKNLKVRNAQSLTTFCFQPTIDIIARRVADGQEDLEPALEMCKDLRRDIDTFSAHVNTEAKTSTATPEFIVQQLRQVLQRVDDTIPWLQLALRSSDIEKGTRRTLISSSRMLRAASALQHVKNGKKMVFAMRLYSMFLGNVRPNTAQDFTWKEEYHKCTVTLVKRESGEFEYELNLLEDFNDLRYHDEDEKPAELKFDVRTLERMYYTKSGELLNIEDTRAPVLVLKITKEPTVTGDNASIKSDNQSEQSAEGKAATSTLKSISKDEAHQATWYALEEWQDDEDDEDDDEVAVKEEKTKSIDQATPFKPTLTILEATIRLAQLEMTEQMDLLQASDDLIDLYMS
ncbi:hypothetical protein INT43_002067 [Umbelopsis isabellina]|uniref:Uncharacterized protein n=1 Tax=Mortierella isabellina TaxID=91625 RepID=A0A8H7PS12_MORIS|nr:hypothetical protein INT43_002067 [Umbelopsis isabellina]